MGKPEGPGDILFEIPPVIPECFVSWNLEVLAL